MGWLGGSTGYHSDDGSIFINKKIKTNVDIWGPGDTIGCGVVFKKTYYNVFYTKNGKIVYFSDYKFILDQYPFVPSISLDTSLSINLNLGQKEFLFPIENMVKDMVKIPKNNSKNNNNIDLLEKLSIIKQNQEDKDL